MIRINKTPTLDQFTRNFFNWRVAEARCVNASEVSDLKPESQVSKLANSTFNFVRRTPEEQDTDSATGFYISKDGLAVVANHSAHPLGRIPDLGNYLAFVNGSPNSTERLRFNDVKDVGLIRVNGVDDADFLKLNPNPIQAREIIYMCGFPEMESSLDGPELFRKMMTWGEVKVSSFDFEELVERAKQIVGDEYDEEIRQALSDKKVELQRGSMYFTSTERYNKGYSGAPVVDNDLNVRAVDVASFSSSPRGEQLAFYPAIHGKKPLKKSKAQNYCVATQIRHVIRLVEDMGLDYRDLANGAPAFP